MGDTNVVPKRGTRVPRRAAVVAAPVLAVALLAVGCSGASSESAAGSPGAAKRAPEQPGRHGVAGSRAQPGEPGQPPLPDDRAIVYTASMTVRVKAVDAAVGRATGIATGLGGYVADESTSEATANGRHDTSRLELRVPVAKYQTAVARMGRELGQRRSLHQTSEDKTTAVQDVDSRVASARSSLRRLRKIMDKATSVSDIMRVEGEISTRESNLESLQAQAKALGRQTSYSTVTLDLVGPRAVTGTKKAEPPGFWTGLTSGWHALVAFLRVTVLVIGAILPFAVPIAVVGAPAWWFWRRRRQGGGAPPPPEPAASE